MRTVSEDWNDVRAALKIEGPITITDLNREAFLDTCRKAFAVHIADPSSPVGGLTRWIYQNCGELLGNVVFWTMEDMPESTDKAFRVLFLSGREYIGTIEKNPGWMRHDWNVSEWTREDPIR